MQGFIDESGQRSRSPNSSDHFVMAAVVLRAEHLDSAAALLASLRDDLDRQPEHQVHWKNIKSHHQRLHAASCLGEASDWLTVSAVVVCKRHLPVGRLHTDEDSAYLYTLRFLLERLSWIARDNGRELSYTLAHVIRFKLEQLREYESRMRQLADCEIAWDSIRPGQIDQPHRNENLQLGDLAASAIAQAFEPDSFGRTEQRYLSELSPALYRRGGGPSRLTSYGLKMHPWDDTTKGAYPWVSTL